MKRIALLAVSTALACTTALASPLLTGPQESGPALKTGAAAPRHDHAVTHLPLTRETALQRAAQRFDLADKDGDGVLTREELRASHRARKEQRQRPAGGHRPSAESPKSSPSR